jgi:hypothetical protein
MLGPLCFLHGSLGKLLVLIGLFSIKLWSIKVAWFCKLSSSSTLQKVQKQRKYSNMLDLFTNIQTKCG